MSETAMAYQWIMATMKADTALMAAALGGVWNGNADIGTLDPYASFGRSSGSDVLTVNVVRLFTHIILQIKGVGPVANYAAIVTIAQRIDALFGRADHVTLSTGGVLACWREQEIAYDEPLVNGVQWSNLGGLYHVELQNS